MIIILFGQTGSGKSYVGQLLANYFNYYFWDADEALPTEMRKYIKSKQSFTDEMRVNYIKIIINKMNELHSKHPALIISQGLYKEKNRNEILRHFPKALFIYLKADSKIIFQRIKSRQNEVDEEFALRILKNFELPLLKHQILLNNDDTDEFILEQFKVILANTDFK